VQSTAHRHSRCKTHDGRTCHWPFRRIRLHL
jgi:hypothetical protein